MKKSSQMRSVNMLGVSLDILTIDSSYCMEDYGHALFEIRLGVFAKNSI